ncbi:hypothetical protein [Arthrobacter sp. SO3]|uniref:hypothetical protein n=1 Tax=Arthrobacter sp. SO3 TaxID=1897057 RepID=UPI001CFF6AD8|nr:hypothetical protein [Arthrobacter sp. SO3]
MPLHGEGMVKKDDGGFETRLTQQGAIESVSSASITVKSEDGFSQTYVLNAGTKVMKLPPPAADGTVQRDSAGKRLKPTAATAADLATGEQVRITGVKDGSGITAMHIVAGAQGVPGPGNGVGTGLGNGVGKHLGHGHWKDQAAGQAP